MFSLGTCGFFGCCVYYLSVLSFFSLAVPYSMPLSPAVFVFPVCAFAKEWENMHYQAHFQCVVVVQHFTSKFLRLTVLKLLVTLL